MIENTEPGTTYDTLKVPAGRPYLLIVFESANSAVCTIQRSNTVSPIQTLGTSAFLMIEAVYNFVMSMKQNQRILTPLGRS